MRAIEAVRARKRGNTDIDLIPVMNLFVTLIPFLLLGATFYHVGVIPTAVPAAAAEGSAKEEDDAIAVTVHLRVTGAGLALRAESPRLDAETLDGLSATLPRTDLEALRSTLHTIKQRYGASETLIVTPEVALRYQEIVGLLDAARALSDDVPLFPVVVLSRGEAS